jgi:hypothetical protein
VINLNLTYNSSISFNRFVTWRRRAWFPTSKEEQEVFNFKNKPRLHRSKLIYIMNNNQLTAAVQQEQLKYSRRKHSSSSNISKEFIVKMVK